MLLFEGLDSRTISLSSFKQVMAGMRPLWGEERHEALRLQDVPVFRKQESSLRCCQAVTVLV